MINKLEDGYKMVRQAVVEFVFHLAEALAFKCDEMLINSLCKHFFFHFFTSYDCYANRSAFHSMKT